MSELLGVIFSVIATIGWGVYLVPMKIAKVADTIFYQAMMSPFILLSTVVACLLLGFSLELSWLGLLAGLVWGAGIFFFTRAVGLAGLALASPVMVSGVMILSFLWGVLFFNEQFGQMHLALAAIAMLVAGAFLVGTIHGRKRTKTFTRGLIFAALGGLVFGSYIVPMNASGLPLEDTLFSMSIGIVASTWLIFFAHRAPFQKQFIPHAAVTGTLWNVANISSLFAVSLAGLAVAFPITQLGVIPPIIIGILFFKELKERRQLLKIILGAAILVVGAMLLGYSKA